MATPTQIAAPQQIIYPDSDGQPMSDNTKQFRWIVTIQGGLDALFRHDPNVFVAGDLLWYPVEGSNTIRRAPDAMLVFGRPKGDRGSYMQWLEDNIAPQVVFEVLSPGNRAADIVSKFNFYQRYGVEEYYIYDPERVDLSGWLRSPEGLLNEIDPVIGWVSPLLGIRFEIELGELVIYRPDGQRFLTYLELIQQQEVARDLAQQESQRAEQEAQRAERLAAKLRELGFDPDSV